MDGLFKETATKETHVCRKFVGEFVFFMFKIADSILEPSLRLYIYAITQQIYWNRTEMDIQGKAAIYLVIYKVLVNVPAVILGLFCGAWSDRVGRKLPVMLCCFGMILASLFYMASILTEPALSLIIVFIGATIRGCFGKSAVITMALHSYIADVSTEGDRTRRLGRLLAMNYFGYCVGSLIGGLLLENNTCRYSSSFCLSILLSSTCVFIAIFFMEESVPMKDLRSREDTPLALTPLGNNKTTLDGTGALDENFNCEDTMKLKNESDSILPSEKPKTLEQPFRWRNMKESLRVLFRSRNDNLRCRLLIMFVLIILVQLCKAGEVDITLLFVEREPFQWADSTYGYLLATDYACMGLVQFLLLPILTKYLKCLDLSLIFFGLLFKAARLLLLTFSFKMWHVYLAIIIGSPLSLIISGLKSLISKTVDEDEIGKTFSTLSCGETIANLLGSLIFNTLYAATANALFPGFVFIVDALVHFCMMFTVCSLARDTKCFSISLQKPK